MWAPAYYRMKQVNKKIDRFRVQHSSSSSSSSTNNPRSAASAAAAAAAADSGVSESVMLQQQQEEERKLDNMTVYGDGSITLSYMWKDIQRHVKLRHLHETSANFSPLSERQNHSSDEEEGGGPHRGAQKPPSIRY
eukprot:CAMPEP_0175147120 /NCGR_PEP_ID=MMETSP0087-20121206/15791_1 /TAXON_ID=136419 /ORGANISM="Unknown Unknown, Strain D1" /LENGTH=135 /DNA_ID=CAMNT_0016432225 /DNA_START=147 /DNA_END=554 /DNA_ORIENTATION=-